MLVDQAIFTSAQTAQRDGYQLVATSPGVSDDDARQLALWCPSHDALVDRPAAKSINFHPLPSGAFCISRTVPAGEEYSARGGPRIHTHCLIVSPEVFARFANDPFAVVNAAVGGGDLDVPAQLPTSLDRLPLIGRASVVNEELLKGLADELGPTSLANVLDQALHARCVALVNGPPAEHVMAGLIACLPSECRLELSFSTGLRHSPQRRFRLLAPGGEPSHHRQLSRQHGISVINLAALRDDGLDRLAAWPQAVGRTLAAGGPAALTACFTRPRPGFTLANLDSLADELAHSGKPETPLSSRPAPSKQATAAQAASLSVAQATRHGPSQTLASLQPEVLEQLEALDDAVYNTIDRQPGALENLVLLWPQAMAQLDADLLESSREQYLDYAMRVWQDRRATTADPHTAIAVLDVLALLYDADL